MAIGQNRRFFPDDRFELEDRDEFVCLESLENVRLIGETSGTNASEQAGIMQSNAK